VVCQHRSSRRHVGKVVDHEEAKLGYRLREVAAEHIRWGRRMAHRLLRREGWTVNHKRVNRLWRKEGLKRPSPRKQKRAHPADSSVRRQQGGHPHQVWAKPLGFYEAVGPPIRRHNRWLAAQFPKRNRRAHPYLPGHPGGQALKAKEVVDVLEGLTSL